MILVDTSVLIDYLKGRSGAKADLLAAVLARDIPFGISGYTYQELLQGAKTEKEFYRLKEYLGSQRLYYLPQTEKTYEQAARMYFELRRAGITVRGTIDVLIALTAIHHGLYLLHSDRDFDSMAEKLPELNIVTSL